MDERRRSRLTFSALAAGGGAGSLAGKGGCSAAVLSSCGGGGPFLHHDSARMRSRVGGQECTYLGFKKTSSSI